MATHHEHPVDVDPQALKDARHMWDMFTKATTWGVAACVILLLLMAFFLVN